MPANADRFSRRLKRHSVRLPVRDSRCPAELGEVSPLHIGVKVASGRPMARFSRVPDAKLMKVGELRQVSATIARVELPRIIPNSIRGKQTSFQPHGAA
ncbi:hypothetical protein B7486_25925 [cyanobacterium TDX16]|nr:hypothetical protein B7486_25925 [cyanobacterium TDX16]